jgi:hypothetical protein
MRSFIAITVRELRDRWALPVASLVFGVVPLVLAIRTGERPLQMSLILAMPTAWTVALMMGASVIARDLGDGRLGFFFARPVPWWTIAGGRLLAALLLTLATAFAAALPSMIVEGNLGRYASGLRESAASGGLAVFLVLMVGLVALGHAAGVVFRSRSPWAALDFFLFAATVLGAILVFRAFVRLGVTGSLAPTSWRFAVQLFLVALVPMAAAAAQVAWGRSDLRRGHRAMSITLWAGALVWYAVIGGLLAREQAATPVDFASRDVMRTTGDGRYLSLLAVDSSERRSRMASFLFDTESGRSTRISNLSWPAFAPDGRHVVWVEQAPFWRRLGQDLDLMLARLDGPAPVAERMELDPPLPEESVRDLTLNTAADRVAVVQGRTLSVHELPSGRSLSRTAAADGEWVTAAFLADGRLRVLRHVRAVVGGPERAVLPGFLEVVELAGGVPSSRVPLEAVSHSVLASSVVGDRILLLEPLAPRVFSLHDVRTGRRLRAFAGEEPWQVKDALLLADGTVAVVEQHGTASRLRLAADGKADRLIELPGEFVAGALGGELPGGRLAVGLFGAPQTPGRLLDVRMGDTVLMVDLATGHVVRREAGLQPVATAYGRGRGSSAVSTLFETQAGELVRLDPDTGARQVLLAASRAQRK